MAAKTAVVTGTARPHGIGRACARAFVRAGYRVLGIDRLRLQDDEALGQQYAHVVLDIGSSAEVGFVPREVTKHFGAPEIHVLVNNAGIADPHMPDTPEAAVAHWRRVIDTNLTGAFLMSQACLPHMPPGDAAIVHISSTRAHQSEAHTEAYAAAKAGLLGLTHAQAISLPHRVRVNVVLPGWIDSSGEPGSLSAADHAWHPAGRVGRPEDVAELVLFLADGSRSGFITGQEFVIDGGVTKKMVYPEEEPAGTAGAAGTAGTAGAAAAGDAAVGTAAPSEQQPAAEAAEQEAAAEGEGLAESSLEVEEDRPPILWPDSN
ncbi:oxidoreductase isoform A [Chlorella sorokiniana]|uniref:Oxidoreductase isoform A n=1 Tax=Chlorella sorokiniana TaxID=3076 RepID=A0A2P6TUA2_CHLSO|nr:oxidoreductase isoform A [Chlorella sorokiniana]|eukprot:PRW57640.1 oxidoreductase isoform A [Chlorella sorokiniana]